MAGTYVGFMGADDDPSQGAICADCGKEMLGEGRASCTRTEISGAKRIPFDGPGNCHDCGVSEGGVHHLGCDSEMCAVCGKQLLIDEDHNPDFANYPEDSKRLMRQTDKANQTRKAD